VITISSCARNGSCPGSPRRRAPFTHQCTWPQYAPTQLAVSFTPHYANNWPSRNVRIDGDSTWMIPLVSCVCSSVMNESS